MRYAAPLVTCLALALSYAVGLEHGRAQSPLITDAWGDTGPSATGATAATLSGLPERAASEAKDVARVAAGLGYTARVIPGDYGTVDVKLTKAGKTPEMFGALQKQWDQRETISLSYVPSDTGLRIVSSRSVVEQKAPVGPWRVVRDTDQVPNAILSAAPPAR